MVTNVERIASHLQGAAVIRRWTVNNIPFTESALGYDLFIQISADSLAGLPIDFKSLCRNMPHTVSQIRQHLSKLVNAGLLEPQGSSFSGAASEAATDTADTAIEHPGSGAAARMQANGDQGVHEPRPTRLIPTPSFLAMLNAYVRESDRVYAVRQNLRGQQLQLADAGPELHAFIDQLYDHFHDLGWLYLHNFGAICFLMASLVCRVARSHGYQARVVSGYVEIIRASDQFRFLLGGSDDAAPGQIPGHAFCVIEESLIVDFGLGNVRRAYHRDFPWGLGCALLARSVPRSPVVGSMVLGNGDRISWKDDWQYPESAAELAKFQPLCEQLVERYRRAFGDVTRGDGLQGFAPGFATGLAPDTGAMALDLMPPANLQPLQAGMSARR